MLREEKLYRSISVLQHMQIIHENGVSNTRSMDRAASEPCNDSNVTLGKERNVT